MTTTVGIARRWLAVLALAAGLSAPPAGAQTAAPAPQVHLIEISSFAFGPARLDAKRGDVVRWTNRDFAPHTATAENGAWTTNAIKNDETGEITLAQDGTFAYRCKYHPAMKGMIVVSP